VTDATADATTDADHDLPPDEPVAQFRRCLGLGHDVALTPEGGARLLPALERAANVG